MSRAVTVLILLAALASAAAQEPAGTGTLQVLVEPADALLVLSGGELDEAVILQPGRARGLEPGSYTVEASREGFEAFRQELAVAAGQAHLLRLPLVADAEGGNREGWGFVSGFTLFFLILFLGGLLVYLGIMQTLYYALVRDALGWVDEVRVEQVPSVQRARATGQAVAVTIEGTNVVPVGRESAEFVARAEDGADLAELAWTVEPADKALVTPKAGAKVKVIASEAGRLKLRASWTDASGVEYEGEFNAVASTARSSSVTIPWVGAGFGSIMLAAIIIGVLVILGFFGILEGGIIGTILGSIAGYLFGFRATREGAQGED